MRAQTVRNHMMVAKYLSGHTMEEIARWAGGLSKQRVQQILKAQGMTAKVRKQRRQEAEANQCRT